MSDDTNRRRYTRRGALGLMGVGGVVMASETLGFTTLTAERDTDIAVESDAQSALKITDSDDGNVAGKTFTLSGDETETFTIENQSTVSLDLTIELTGKTPESGSGNVSISSENFDFNSSITSGGSTSDTLSLSQSSSGKFELGITDSDDADTLNVEIDITAEYPGTSINFVRQITMKD